jgi:mannose-6-phosphate isomerase
MSETATDTPVAAGHVAGTGAAVTGDGLTTRMVEKPWGVADLPPPFAGQGAGAKIGEIWFEPPAQLPELLVKYIFTSEPLSVQVHPTDAQTLAAGLGRQGKEECWVVIDAKPGATLGIGLKEAVSKEALRAAALDGSIEQMLVWHEVKRGDFFYIPANTIHAIGAGVSVIETQQNSDITYRLYDYGRGRELHLDKGLNDAIAGPYDLARWHRTVDLPVPEANGAPVGADAVEVLVPGPLFRLARIGGRVTADRLSDFAGGPLLVLPITGEVRVAGLAEEVTPGGCAVALDMRAVTLAPDGVYLVAQAIAH